MIRYEETLAAECLFTSLGTLVKPGPFDVDEENRKVISLIIAWACNDPGFLASPLIKNTASLEKGLTLMGNVGSGKSLLMTALSYATRQFEGEYDKYFYIEYCDKIEHSYSRKGPESIDYLLQKRKASKNNNILLDELGYEKPVKWFGNDKKEVLEDIIMARTRMWESDGIYTHYTTNLKQTEIEARYGNRAYSRIMGSTNIIVLGGAEKSKDRRQPEFIQP